MGLCWHAGPGGQGPSTPLHLLPHPRDGTRQRPAAHRPSPTSSPAPLTSLVCLLTQQTLARGQGCPGQWGQGTARPLL